jgi:hypothetical protein
MITPNVLGRAPRPTEKSYLDAVRDIILAVQAKHDLTDQELADRLGCSDGTIANARNRASKLGGPTLAALEHEFGPGAIDPFLALGGSRAAPICRPGESGAEPNLPLVQALHTVIEFQSPSSDQGSDISDAECARGLLTFKQARCALDDLIARGERHLASVVVPITRT